LITDAARLAQQLGRTGKGVPQHHHVGFHRFQVFSGIQQGLPFNQAAHTGGDGEAVGAEPLGRDVKGELGSGAGFIKKKNDRLAPQGRHLFNGALRYLPHAPGGVENQPDLIL
jgi:hypothetical protein